MSHLRSRERHSEPRCTRSFLTCHRRSKFHSSCAALALISCETPRLPPWVHRSLHSHRIRVPGYVFHVDHDLRVPVDRPKTHAVIAADPRPTFGPTYVDNHCHVCISAKVPCRIQPRFPSRPLNVLPHVQPCNQFARSIAILVSRLFYNI